METLNILQNIYKMNNPDTKAEYGVTKLVEDVEFIDNDSRDIMNVSENPILKFWNQTCLLLVDSKYSKKTILICLMQVSRYMFELFFFSILCGKIDN